MTASTTADRGRADDLRSRPRPEPGELPAADAPELPRPGGTGVSRPCRRDPWAPAPQLCGSLRTLPPPRLGPGCPGHRARRHRRGDARQHARDDRGSLRGADDGGRAQHPEHPPRCRRPRLLPRSRRGQGSDHRPGIRARRGARPRLGPGEPPGDRCGRPGICGAGRGPGQPRLRGPAGGGGRGFGLGDAGRRVGCDLAQLHLGHHRRPEGRGLSSPRRRPAVSGQRHHRQPGTAPGLSLDPADVPLQRLVLRLDALGGGRHPCLPAAGPGRRPLRRPRRARGHASLRRADRDAAPAQRARSRAPPPSPAASPS